MRSMKRLRPATLSLLLLLAFINNSFAQDGGGSLTPPSRASAAKKRARRHRPAKRTTQPAVAAPSPPAPSATPQQRGVVSSVESYTYRLDSNTPLKVYLAPLGQVLIEAQANDPVYKVHPSQENFVAVDRLSDDSLSTDPVVLRAGTGFRVGGKGEVTPATIINLQMFSGAIIPVIVIPTNDIERNTLRVAITYDRDKVERARQAAGLPVRLEQLQEKESAAGRAKNNPAPGATTQASQPQPYPQPTPPPAAPVVASNPASSSSGDASAREASYNVAGDDTTLKPRTADSRREEMPAPSPAAVVAAPPAPSRPAASTDDAPPAPSDKLVALTRDELLSVVRGKPLKKFSKPAHGLSIAASRSREIDAQTRIVVVAVRNTLAESVRLVPGQPELAVEILDDKKRLVDTREIVRLYMQTTLRDNVLGPGETGYFAVVFRTPILGTHEYLRARVAQVFAADAPVTADLVITAR
ncbi:MAG TPA: hypothetical protein VGB98_16060 [Pyrinomonadaceae bacterium]|jgi:hypothetical protein